jgi:hypothetical protein
MHDNANFVKTKLTTQSTFNFNVQLSHSPGPYSEAEKLTYSDITEKFWGTST